LQVTRFNVRAKAAFKNLKLIKEDMVDDELLGGDEDDVDTSDCKNIEECEEMVEAEDIEEYLVDLSVQMTIVKKDTKWALDYSECKIMLWDKYPEVNKCETKFPRPNFDIKKDSPI
jgi:hypothetical protein